MTDYVINFTTLARLQVICQALGIWKGASPKTGIAAALAARPVITGTLSRNDENFFFNYVGVVYAPTGATTTDADGNEIPVMAAQPGLWARIRYNGPVPDALLANPPTGVTIYPPVKYLADGVTPDPDYVQPPYGQIA